MRKRNSEKKFDEGLKKAYDLHSDIAKQLITICTALLGTAIAAAKIQGIDIDVDCFFIAAAILLLLSILLGILHLGALASAAIEHTNLNKAWNVRGTAIAQQLSFWGALICAAINIF